MAVNSVNVHVFGSDDDVLYLGPSGLNLGNISLETAIPKEMIDTGWLTDDGVTLGMKDSVKAIQGHQGHANVLQFMDSSDTTLEATLMESQLQTFLWNLDADAEDIDGVTKITAASSRKVLNLCAIWDTFDTQHSGIHWRYVFPSLTLGERDDIPFKVGEASAYKYSLGVLEKFFVFTNAAAMKAGGAPAKTVTGVTITTLDGATVGRPSSLKVGEKVSLAAEISYSDGTKAVKQTDAVGLTWTSSDKSKATIDGGVVTGVSAGKADITASIDGKTSEALSLTINTAA
ncbi:Ig-like domain-containing protein [Propionibacterium freudenreichii]|uniref:Ig-like domain-containing protein n=1 Tax=Propionibacterium freudenreichii TaxID=1744 RepID=UPI003854AA2F